MEGHHRKSFCMVVREDLLQEMTQESFVTQGRRQLEKIQLKGFPGRKNSKFKFPEYKTVLACS